MGDDHATVRRAGSRRRSPAVAQQLKARQERRNEQRAAQRERQKRIEDAYEAFTTAFGAIEEAKLATADKVAALNEQIAQAHGQEKETIAGEQRKQALAAAAIRAEVSSVDEVAEQLQISVTEARHLLKMVRTATDSASSPAPKTAKPRLPGPSQHTAEENGKRHDLARSPGDAPGVDSSTPAPTAPLPQAANGLRDGRGESRPATGSASRL